MAVFAKHASLQKLEDLMITDYRADIAQSKIDE
jgi:hypothetical protein